MTSSEKKKSLIAEKMAEVMEILGLDLNDPSLKETPNRIARMYIDEVFSGLDPQNFPKLTFQEENIPQEMVLIKNISFVSFCEHHFVPIVGKAHVGYFPHKKIMGISKIPRLVNYFAKRPQVQERLTAQISDSLIEHLGTEDVAICTQAIHFCMVARGVQDCSASMESHILKGCFENNTNMRAEFFSRISTPDSIQSFI